MRAVTSGMASMAKVKGDQVMLIIQGSTGVAAVSLAVVGGGLNKTVLSDADGNYEFGVPHGWTGIVTPSKTDYTFTPASNAYTDMNESELDENYLYVSSEYDFSAMADGSLPTPWVGDTWSISDGKAINTPTLGDDYFNEGAGTFDSGTYDWVAYGNNTIVNDTNCLKITYVDNAAGANLRLNSGLSLNSKLTVGQLYKITFETKVNTGSVTTWITGPSGPPWTVPITETDYASHTIYFVAWGTTTQYLRFSGFDAGEILWIRNIVLKEVSTPFSSLPSGNSDMIIKAGWTSDFGEIFGLVLNADKPVDEDPQNYVILLVAKHYYDVPTGLLYQLYKVVDGVATCVLAELGADPYSATALVEVRKTGSTYSLYYNGVQKGSDQTISDASIVDNTYHGMMSTGGSPGCDAFFQLSQPVDSMNVVYLGGSITYGNNATSLESTSWRALTTAWMRKQFFNYSQVHVNSGIGGTSSWYGLVRLESDVIGYLPGVVFIDFAVNDTSDDGTGERSDGFAPAAEALLRRIRTESPDTRIICQIFNWPDGYTATGDGIRVVRDKWITLASAYDCDMYRWDQYLESLMGDDYTDDQVDVYFAAHNNVHPNDTGHETIFDNIAINLTSVADNNPGTLPDRVYSECEDFEATPIIRTGVDNDGETGTWSTSGTMRVSSTADSTITWTGNFCSFGIDNNDAETGVISYSVDGGDFVEFTLTTKPTCLWNGTKENHTVIFKVVSGTVTIENFIAI